MDILAIIILVLAAVFAIYWTFRINKVIPQIINFGMAIAVFLVVFPWLKLYTGGFYIYLGFLVLAFFYGLADRNRKLIDRLVICLMTAGIFLYWLWTMNHWHGNTLLAAIFVLLIAAAGMLTRTKLRNELGFLSIIAADAIAILLNASY